MLTSRTRALYLIPLYLIPYLDSRSFKGDLSVFCLYKAQDCPRERLLGPSRPAKRPLDRRPGALELARRHAGWVRSLAECHRAVTLWAPSPGDFAAAPEFDSEDPSAVPWSTTRSPAAAAGAPSAAEGWARTNLELAA